MVRVVNRGQSGEAGPFPLGLKFATLALEQSAYVAMPIWIKVSLPFGWEHQIRYPFRVHPTEFGCNDLEVRRGSRLVPRILIRPSNEMVMGGSGPCGFIGLPREQTNIGRLPLHLLYHFDDPGKYEVRYVWRNWRKPSPVVAESEWTPIEVRAQSKDQRSQWLARMTATHPSDTTDLLSDFLPSILGVPDEASLAIVSQDLYHRDSLVRRYVLGGLGYWPDSQVGPMLERLLREKGPSDVIASYLSRNQQMTSDQADKLLETSLPYLHSESPVLIGGAVEMIRVLAWPGAMRVSAAARAKVETAMIENGEHILRVADPQTALYYTMLLGQMKK